MLNTLYGPVAQLVRAPPCHGGGREFESHLGRFLRDLSSAGRASALQAEGHRFEPYRSHFYGGIAQLARAHGSYPWCRGFKSPFRYFFMPEILYRIECANRISCQKWHEFFCVFLSMCGCRIRSDAALKCVNNAGNVINCDKISKNVTKMFQIFLKNFKNVLTS